MRGRWHILHENGDWVLARHLPVRFDLMARGAIAWCHPVRLMHQIRQDVWRALQGLRGFSPVVRLARIVEGWSIEAGGRVTGPVAPVWEARLIGVLENGHHKARWQRHAGPWEGRE